MKIKKVCSQCGGTDINLDAWAYWDEDAQRWMLDEVFDAAFCRDCDGECHIEDREAVA